MINILNTINDYVLIINKYGHIKFCNDILLNKLKYQKEELNNIDSILFNCNLKSIQKSLSSNDLELNLIFYTKSKEQFILNTKIIIYKFEDEEAIFLIGKSVEEDYLDHIKNEFFINISHEFKTPLNLILGTMQLMDKNITKGKIVASDKIDLNKYTKCIKQNSYRLLRLVNNIIDMTIIDSGYYKLQLGNYNIISIIEDITMSVSEYMEQLGINLIFDTDSEETILACDPDKIERIILNLLSNSIKYTKPDGEISVYIKNDTSNVFISVKDSGLGISKEKLPHIFEKYVQDDNKDYNKTEGSGIGLSLVKSLVDMHGGNIFVTSELGKGSEFIFEIPIKLIDEDVSVIKQEENRDIKIEKCNVEFSDIYSL